MWPAGAKANLFSALEGATEAVPSPDLLGPPNFCLGLDKLILIVRPALQGRTVILVLRVLTAFVSRRSTPQAGLVGVLLLDHLAAILQHGEARLHIVELGSRDHVLRFGGQD